MNTPAHMLEYAAKKMPIPIFSLSATELERFQAAFRDMETKVAYGFLRDLFNRIPHPVVEKRPHIPTNATLAQKKRIALMVSQAIFCCLYESWFLIVPTKGLPRGQEPRLWACGLVKVMQSNHRSRNQDKVKGA